MSTVHDVHHSRQAVPTASVSSTGMIATAAGTGAVASAAFILGFALLAGQSARENTLSPYTLTINVITVLSFAALAISLPSLRRALDVPGWVITTCAAACAAIAAMAWSLTTLGAHHATKVTDDEFLEFSTYLNIFPGPKMLLGLVGFTALGITGWRRRSVPRGACILFVLAGLTSVWWAYPPATIFAGVGLLWTTRSIESSTRGRTA